MDTTIDQWKPEDVYDGAIIFAVGDKNTGKTVAIDSFIYTRQKTIPTWIYCSPTRYAKDELHRKVPPATTFYVLTRTLLNSIIHRQQVLKHMKETGVIPANTNIRLGLVLDDTAFDGPIFNDKMFKYIIFNGRHLDLTIIMGFQYLMKLPRDVRMQVDVVIATHDEDLGNVERLYQMFPFFNTAQDFTKQFVRGTEHNIVWVSERRAGGKRYLHWWKARDPLTLPDFRTGTEYHWQINDALFSPQKLTEFVQTGILKLLEKTKKDEETPSAGIGHLLTSRESTQSRPKVMETQLIYRRKDN
jgi:hypothetical protein